eukprot:4358318-Amphidinium_carterae.2
MLYRNSHNDDNGIDSKCSDYNGATHLPQGQPLCKLKHATPTVCFRMTTIVYQRKYHGSYAPWP